MGHGLTQIHADQHLLSLVFKTLQSDLFFCMSQRAVICTTNVRFLEILLSIFPVLVSNLFGSFEFWSFEFVSNFELRIWLRLCCAVFIRVHLCPISF